MGTIGKAIVGMLLALLPLRLRRYVFNRIQQTKRAFTSNKYLTIFWTVLFTPIVIVVSLIIAFLKTIVIWITPNSVYVNTRYAINQFFTDIVQKQLSFITAWNRLCLFLELITKGKEKKVSYGSKNPELTFFIVRPYYYMEKNDFYTSISNLFFHYYRALQHIAYAISRDWIPVVDWKNYGPFPFEEDEPINNTTNCWEYFWKQPSSYTLEEAYQSKNVILSSQNTVDYGLIPSTEIRRPYASYAQRLAVLCHQYDKYISFNDATEEYVQEKRTLLFPEGARILGVSIRGVSYGERKVQGHPIQPSIRELVQMVKKNMEKWEMDYVYFACELATHVSAMYESFGDQLITLPRLRYEKSPTSEDNPLYEPGKRYQTNLDYLTEVYLLSECTSLMGGMSSGVRTAIIWNEDRYENVEILDKGAW